MVSETANILLLAGPVAAGLFFTVATVESLIRPGFDLRRHAISMLSLGPRGWTMAGTFVVSGLLTLAFAAGVQMAGGGLAPAVLMALYGAGLVIAGVWHAPAGQGFPPGTPLDQEPVMDRAATLHSVGFMVGFGSLILGAFALAITFGLAGDMAMATFCGLTGLVIPALIAAGITSTVPTGIAFYLAAMMAWVLVTVTALRLMAST